MGSQWVHLPKFPFCFRFSQGGKRISFSLSVLALSPGPDFLILFAPWVLPLTDLRRDRGVACISMQGCLCDLADPLSDIFPPVLLSSGSVFPLFFYFLAELPAVFKLLLPNATRD